jgi:CDP-diacylglycerol--glycerol-3-phosphate 3-phosphatidyltransferase
MPKFVFLSQTNRERYLRIVEPIGRFLGRLRIHPNILSLAGLLLSVAAGLVYSTGAFFWGAWVVVLAGTCDVLDGQLARQSGRISRFGAFFDSTLDRFSEVFIYMGLAWHFAGGAVIGGARVGQSANMQSPLTVILIILAVAGSFMVSYTRARAEGLGVECKVGWMQRPERMTLLIIGSLLGSLPAIGPVLFKVSIFLIALLSNYTALQRMIHVRSQLPEEKMAS